MTPYVKEHPLGDEGMSVPLFIQPVQVTAENKAGNEAVTPLECSNRLT